MTLPTRTYEAGLVIDEDTEIAASTLLEPARLALALFGAEIESSEAGLEEAMLVAEAVSVEIRLDDEAEDGLRVAICVTQHGPLPSNHPEAGAALLAEMLHAGIEATGATEVEWGAARIPARTFQETVPPLRHASNPAALAVCMPAEAAEEEETAEAPDHDTAPILLPRRVRPATVHRLCGTAVNRHTFKTRRAAARRMARWENFDDYVEAEVARMTSAPGEPLENIFRADPDVRPGVAARRAGKVSPERRVAAWTVAASLTLVAPGFTGSAAATLQALPF